MNIKDLSEVFLHILFPRICPFCTEVLTQKNSCAKNPFVCDSCYESLRFAKKEKTKSHNPVINRGVAYKKDRVYYDERLALLTHNEEAKKLLYALKYSNRRENADFAGKETAIRFGRQILLWAPDAFIPVPLHKRREFERDFNQSELIAQRISDEVFRAYGVRIPVDGKTLLREKKTAPQKDLSVKERHANVKGKFGIKKDKTGNAIKPEHKSVVLIDDIFTSGATVNECARILKKAGVEQVFVITISEVEE